MESWMECGTLGERLKWVRETRLGLVSTHDVARFWERVPPERRPNDCSYGSVNRYEKEVRLPRVDYVIALARESGVNIAWIMTGEGSPDDPLTANDEMWEAEAFRTIASYVEAVRSTPPVSADEARARAEELRRGLRDIPPGSGEEPGGDEPPQTPGREAAGG